MADALDQLTAWEMLALDLLLLRMAQQQPLHIVTDATPSPAPGAHMVTDTVQLDSGG